MGPTLFGHPPEKSYSPSVPTGLTSTLFNHIPQDGPWQIPQSFRQEGNWDKFLQEWIGYLDHAAEGNQIILNAISTNVADGASENIKAAEYFNSALPADTYREKLEKVLSVRRALAALLSKDARKKLNLKNRDIRASAGDIQNARTLVKEFDLDTFLPPEEKKD